MLDEYGEWRDDEATSGIVIKGGGGCRVENCYCSEDISWLGAPKDEARANRDGRLSVPVSIALILFSALLLWAAIYGAISEI